MFSLDVFVQSEMLMREGWASVWKSIIPDVTCYLLSTMYTAFSFMDEFGVGKIFCCFNFLSRN